MFDVQKYALCISIGNFLYDFVFCLLNADNSGLQMQTYAHHILAIVGCVLSLIHQGFFGSICQISCITEASTFFVNFRSILAYHKIKTGNLNLLNGFGMLVSFFLVRVVFYSYIIFGPLVEKVILKHNSFWNLYEDWTHKYC